MTINTIEIERAANVATVALVRPEKLNALTTDMWKGLRAAFETVSADGSVRVVVLRGAGGRAFSVGADIGEFEQTRAGKPQAIAFAEVVHDCVRAIQDCPHPTIAAIEGLCVGGGVEIAAACDLRFASSSSRFGVPIQRLGLTVDYPELDSLKRLVGPSNALEILYEGRIFGADEALQKGLVNRIVADAVFAEELAGVVGRAARRALAQTHGQATRRAAARDSRRTACAARGLRQRRLPPRHARIS